MSDRTVLETVGVSGVNVKAGQGEAVMSLAKA
jgi:hypothetical protein